MCLCACLYWTSALDHTDEHHRDRQNQQDVNEPAQGVGTHHSEQPQDKEQHEDRPQHGTSSALLVWQTGCQRHSSPSARVSTCTHGLWPLTSKAVWSSWRPDERVIPSR